MKGIRKLKSKVVQMYRRQTFSVQLVEDFEELELSLPSNIIQPNGSINRTNMYNKIAFIRCHVDKFHIYVDGTLNIETHSIII